MHSEKSHASTPRALTGRGFTLIELMIAVAVIAILAAVAYPSYQDYIRKGRRSDAIAEVSRVQQAQEKFRANNTSYSNDFSSAATGLAVVTGTTAVTSYTSPLGYYTITSQADASAPGSAYTVTATAVAGKSQTSDTNCQCLRVAWSGANASYLAASMTAGTCGSFATTNASTCWRQ
jgi:type IV pilus assembly protein PilE